MAIFAKSDEVGTDLHSLGGALRGTREECPLGPMSVTAESSRAILGLVEGGNLG